MATNKTVDYRFKILYAIGMIMVVASHASGGGITALSDWFPYHGVHLALFMFCSGYFYKSSAEDNVSKYILKKIQVLIVPFYIYNVVYGLIVQFLRTKGFEMGGDFNLQNLTIAPITSGHQFVYNMGGWFLVPLFMVEIYNVLLHKLIKRIYKNTTEWAFGALEIFAGILGNQLACMGYRQNWWLVLVRMLYFAPFYELGILYRSKLETIDKKIPSFWYFAVLFAAQLAIIYHYGKVPSYIPSWCGDFVEGPIMPIVIGVLGIALWLRIANLLEPVIGRSKWINAIADSTYSIMMNQFLGFMIVKTGYALLSKIGSRFSDFDFVSYKTDIWWFYTPKGITQTLIVYVVAGLVFPIFVQKAIDQVKQILSARFSKQL